MIQTTPIQAMLAEQLFSGYYDLETGGSGKGAPWKKKKKKKSKASKWEFFGTEASGSIWIRSTSKSSEGLPLLDCSKHSQWLSCSR